MTSGRDKVLPIPLKCLGVVVLESLREEDSNDIYVCLSSICGSPAMKTSILRCRSNLNLTLPPNCGHYQRLHDHHIPIQWATTLKMVGVEESDSCIFTIILCMLKLQT